MAFLDYAGLSYFKGRISTEIDKVSIYYAVSETAGGTADKTASLTGFTLITGRYIAVKFTNTNTAGNVTLNVNSTGAKPLYYAGEAIPYNMIQGDNIYIFRYNGAQYDLMSGGGGGESGGGTCFVDVDFTIQQSAWTLINDVYVAEVSNVLITDTAGIDVSYTESIRSSIVGDIFDEKQTGKVVFKTYTQPVGALSGMIRIFDGIRSIVSGVAPIEVGGTGAATASGARANLHAPASESIADPYSNAETYAAGARVIHDNKVYRCIHAINESEEWDDDHWVETTIDNELNLLAASVGTVSEELKHTVKSVNNVRPNESGEVDVNRVSYADNLVADDAQSSSGEFIERTTGGDASLSDGDAWLSKIRGASIHTGQIPQEVNMIIEYGHHEPEEEYITAVINNDTFIAEMTSDSGTKVFTFSSSWDSDPADYGITVANTPVYGDKITVTYQKEHRGTITVSTPTSFVSTNWNLYNHSSGYARVLKYSETHGFLVEGTYTTLEFSETLSGTRTTITPVDGFFEISADGYVWVTGGNNTDTCIYMTWSDWTNGHAGDFEAYSESTISLSSIISNFPNGLMQVAAVRDEIDFSLSVATSNIERLAYNSTNLATAKASGRPYDADENYIYLVRETPVTYDFTVDGSYSAYDHGMEFVTGTTIPVYSEMLYGQNLKDKLRTDVLTISEQTLTAAQQTQVQANLGLNEELNTKLVKVDDSGGLYCGDSANSGFTPLKSPSKYCGFGFKNAAGNNGGIVRINFGNATNMTTNQISFYEYSPKETADTGSTGKYEQYVLPAPTAGMSANKGYYILTTKTIDSITATTSSSGVITVTLPSAGIVLSAWCASGDRLVLPFAQNSATASGKKTWYLKVFNTSTMAVVANTEYTVYYIYICP